MNVLLTIIIEGYERVKQELEGKGNELEVIDYMKTAIKSILGRKERPNFLHEFIPEDYIHQDPVQEVNKNENITSVSELPEKFDKFVEVKDTFILDTNSV